MSRLTDLFAIEILSSADNQLTAKVQLNAAHEVFDGHFPNNPITPGVVQVQMVRDILQMHYKQPMKLETMNRCKFLAVLNPTETESIEVTINVSETEEGLLKAGAEGKDAEQSFFKFNATYSKG